MKQTPSQTVGPFYSIGLTDRAMNTLVGESTQGQRIRIEGQVIDGDGKPVPDAVVAAPTRRDVYVSDDVRLTR